MLHHLRFIHMFLCGLRLQGGHAFLYRSAKGKLWLECQDCGLETPGWDIVVTIPKAT
jgi:hypothetical protein